MKCKKCGGHMTVNYSKVLTSLPPMYEAKCDECGSIDYFYCHECSEITDEDVTRLRKYLRSWQYLIKLE